MICFNQSILQIYQTKKSLGKGPGWIIDSVIDYTISISKYNPWIECSYIKSPKELDHPRKGLIKIQNADDNECFKWCLVRYLNLTDNNLRGITKADKDFAKRLDFKNIKFPAKIRDIHKIEKKNLISIRVFGYENKGKYPIYVSKLLIFITYLLAMLKKLVLNLFDKAKYVIHYENLQLYLRLELKLKKCIVY